MTKRTLITAVCLLALLSAAAHAQEKVAKMMAHAAEVGSKSLALIIWRVNDGTGERRMSSLGVCILVDEEGKGVLLAMGMDPTVPTEFYGAFEVAGPGMGGKRLKASLMGVDPLSGVGFVHVDDSHDWKVVRFAKESNVSIGDPVVSVGLLAEDLSFAPYVGTGAVSTIVHMPEANVCVAKGGLTSYGSPVFGANGQAIGLVGQQFPARIQMLTQGRMILFGEMGGQWTMWFRPVEEFVSALDNIPASPDQVAPLAWIGAISMEGVPENLWEINGMTTPGVKLHDVIPGHPAQKGGLATGDIIVGVKGQPLAKYPTPNQTVKAFARTMARLGVGASVEVDVVRNSKPMRAVLTLAPAPKRPSQAWRHAARNVGVIVREKVDVDQYIDKTPTGKVAGLIVLRVGKETAAERAGVETGDTIAAVNGEKVTTIAAFKVLIERALTDGKPVDLAISRSGQDIAVRVRLPEAPGG